MILAPSPVTPLQRLNDPLFDLYGVQVWLKREDLVHPVISGNKWHKLKYNLVEAQRQGLDTLLSFGGAYSNHIHALAGAGALCGFKTIGVIRGEAYEPLNPTLQYAVAQGMQLHYMCRADYRHKTSADVIDRLRQEYGSFYLIPEGGSNALAVQGCAELAATIDVEFDTLVCACGTGATLAGLVVGLAGRANVLGVAVLKGAGFLQTDVGLFLQGTRAAGSDMWRLALDYHCGGYAKSTQALMEFIDSFELRHGVLLDPVYTGKMMFALYQMIEAGEFAHGARIVALHSGGLQGRPG